MGSTNNAEMTAEEHDQYDVPNALIQHEAGELSILDEHGNKTAFNTLYAATAGSGERHVIVFIRHFYCGVSPVNTSTRFKAISNPQ